MVASWVMDKLRAVAAAKAMMPTAPAVGAGRGSRAAATPVTDKAVTNASSAARVAKHKAKNPDAVRARNAATKRASRAKAAKP